MHLRTPVLPIVTQPTANANGKAALAGLPPPAVGSGSPKSFGSVLREHPQAKKDSSDNPSGSAEADDSTKPNSTGDQVDDAKAAELASATLSWAPQRQPLPQPPAEESDILTVDVEALVAIGREGRMPTVDELRAAGVPHPEQFAESLTNASQALSAAAKADDAMTAAAPVPASMSAAPKTPPSDQERPLPVPDDFFDKLRASHVPAEIIEKIADAIGIHETETGVAWNPGVFSQKAERAAAPVVAESSRTPDVEPTETSGVTSSGNESSEASLKRLREMRAAEGHVEFVDGRRAPHDVREKNAALPEAGSFRTGAGVLTLGIEKKEDTLSTDSELVRVYDAFVGTNAANRGEVSMTPRPSLPEPMHRAADVSHAAASREVSETAPSLSARAVEVVREIKEVGASLGLTRRHVDLNFDFGAENKLSVRVEMRSGEVHATFRTSSTELRDALSQAWQAESTRDWKQKLADPVFVSAPAREESRSFADAHSRQQQQPQDRESNPVPNFTVPFSATRNTVAAVPSPVSPAVVVASDRQLRAFA